MDVVLDCYILNNQFLLVSDVG